MVEKSITIENKMGLHARPASEFVAFTKKLNSKITIGKGGKSFDGKSILGLLAAGISCGSTIIIQAHGENENEELDQLVSFLENLKD